MNRRGFILWIILLVILLIVGFFWFASVWNEEDNGEIKCVPASCCHATTCVPEGKNTPNCEGFICTEECEPGTLDCNQARCEYIDGKCEVVLNS